MNDPLQFSAASLVPSGALEPRRAWEPRAVAKIPPMDLDVERAILGNLLLGGDVTRVLGRLHASDFYTEAHRAVYRAILALVERKEPVDTLTVQDELHNRGELALAGGPAALAGALEEASVAVNLDAYVRIVVEKSRLRDLIVLGRQVEHGASNGSAPAELLAELTRTVARLTERDGGGSLGDYIEPIEAFLAEEDPPGSVVFPDLLPSCVIMLLHGEPRARKSLAAFELALAAAIGTPPFGLERFRPQAPIRVLYIQEEDPRSLTRARLRRLVRERCGAHDPATLSVSVRRGVNLDDPAWVARLTEDLKRLGAKLLVLDAARRLSMKTDEGPAKVRELIGVLRAIVVTAAVTIVIVHHDVKPPRDGQDQRRRGQRASGGDWFAGCECPVHVERVSDHETLVYPQDYKFAADPAPFTFTCDVEDGLIARLAGTDITSERAERAGVRGKILDWLRANGPASKTAMKKAGLGRWETLEGVLDTLCREGKVDAGPGRKAGSLRYFVPGESSPASGDGSTGSDDD